MFRIAFGASNLSLADLKFSQADRQACSIRMPDITIVTQGCAWFSFYHRRARGVYRPENFLGRIIIFPSSTNALAVSLVKIYVFPPFANESLGCGSVVHRR